MKPPELNTLNSILDGAHSYKAPVFQRYYVWGEEELSALIEDIDSSGDDSAQFIGAIVVQDFGKQGGSTSPNEYLIIDGQQRLTTLYLIICGLVKLYLASNRLEQAETLASAFLAGSAGSFKGVPKLLPTVQDRKKFLEILKSEITCIEWKLDSIKVSDKPSKQKALEHQWRRVLSTLQGLLCDVKGSLLTKRIQEFENKVLHQLEFVQITLEKGDDANTTFSKLNFRGIPLSLADLVRNDVFSRLTDSSSVALNKFYDDVWSPFEQSFPGKSFEQYVSIYATIKFNGAITKSRAFPELQRSWAKKKPAKIVSELSEFAELYSVLVDFQAIPHFDKKVNEKVRRFSLLPKTTVTWPYILKLLKDFEQGKCTKTQTLDCLHIVESFLVRRAITGLEPTGLHAVFKNLWQKVGSDKAKLKSKIVTNTISCPEDLNVLDSLRHDNMYSRHITKFLMIAREVSFATSKGYDLATDDFSVEHVLPKNMKDKEWTTEFSELEHRDLLNAIGNLTPLTKKQNTQEGNQPWSKKKKAFKGSNWKVTQKLASRTKWTKTTILNLTNEFSLWVTQEWPEI